MPPWHAEAVASEAAGSRLSNREKSPKPKRPRERPQLLKEMDPASLNLVEEDDDLVEEEQSNKVQITGCDEKQGALEQYMEQP